MAKAEIFGLLGPNGAGKTTTVESIVGLRVPDAGTIRVFGLDPVRQASRVLQGSLRRAKQRLSIALALIGRPTIAVLDELTTGLDPQARRDTWDLVEAVRDRGVTIVLVTHDMEEARHLCDRVALVDAGRVVAIRHA